MPEGVEREGDKVAKAIFDAAVATKRFDRVIDPMDARFQAFNNRELQDAAMGCTTKLRSLGVSDREGCRKIGEIDQVDTIVVGDVGKWGRIKYGDEKAGEVGMAIKMVDSETGSMYGKASHAAKKTDSRFKPDLVDMAAGLAKKIFEYVPKSKWPKGGRGHDQIVVPTALSPDFRHPAPRFHPAEPGAGRIP